MMLYSIQVIRFYHLAYSVIKMVIKYCYLGKLWQQKEIQNTIKIDHAVHASYVAKQFLITHTMGDGKRRRKHFSGSTGKVTLKVVVVYVWLHQKEANRTHQVGYKPKWSNVLTLGSGIENEEDKSCAYPSCTNSQVIAPSFASQSEIIFFCKFKKNQYHQFFYVQCIIKNCINK